MPDSSLCTKCQQELHAFFSYIEVPNNKRNDADERFSKACSANSTIFSFLEKQNNPDHACNLSVAVDTIQ